MKKRIAAALLCGLLLLSLCASCGTRDKDDGVTLRIAATTYPLYLFTTALTDGAEGVEVTQLVTDQISCLHDYTLTVTAMKAIERADVLVLNGAGLEEFMDDALAVTDAAVINCSEGVTLLLSQEEHHHGHEEHDHEDEDHDHDEEFDPHFWLDPQRVAIMLENICEGLSNADPAHSEAYRANLEAAQAQLDTYAQKWADMLSDAELSCRELITFHDGFAYLADAFGLTVLKAIEEEAGSEASAAEIREIISLIESHDIPVIFTEENGSDTTAKAIARETGIQTASLTMIMSGTGTGLTPYLEAMDHNIKTLADSLGGKEVQEG